ncbi:MAG: aspartate-semialdehyde dehydrogenase [Phycisphaerales bacterium]|nr:aspartate-semialdehyde dehydrogenase [Phycisphaerales bacterium]
MKISDSGVSVAVVGATGAVGVEMLAVLEQRTFPVRELKLLASGRSAGKTMKFAGRDVTLEALDERSLAGVELALFSAGSGISKQFAPAAAKRGTVVVDNSSAFRMDPGVALVVPEINPQAIPGNAGKGAGGGCIIANPNCSAIIMALPLTPLHKTWGIERVVVSTYQAASGAGAQAMEELRSQTLDVLEGRPAKPKVFHEPYAFNLFSHNAAVNALSGMNGEEEKMIAETRKIWGDDEVKIAPTCVRVPVMRAHAQSINVTLASPATLDQVREAIASAAGVKLLDDRAGNLFPTPLKASGQDDVLVGRLREDLSQTPARFTHGSPTLGFEMFIAGDQLRKGAALNAVQIAELVFAGRF